MNLPTPKQVKDAVLVLKQASCFVAELSPADIPHLTFPASMLRSDRIAVIVVEMRRG